jgi:hypothetical protein
VRAVEGALGGDRRLAVGAGGLARDVGTEKVSGTIVLIFLSGNGS